MDRVAVISSCPGAGKTTFARRLASQIDAPHVELDALFWGPNWTPLPLEVYRQRVAAAVAAQRWVLDGNYRSVRDLVWPRVDTIVWLDYPLRIAYPRLLRRTFGRWRSGEELWPSTGNRETLRLLLFSWDSILWWSRTYRGRRRRFEADLAKPEHGHIRVVRPQSPREAHVWLDRLPAQATV